MGEASYNGQEGWPKHQGIAPW